MNFLEDRDDVIEGIGVCDDTCSGVLDQFKLLAGLVREA